MEILAGIIISISTEIFKWMNKKWGKELSKGIVLLIVFLLALIGAWINNKGYFTEFIENWTVTVAMAIAWYQIVQKKILIPLFSEEEGKDEE